MKPWRLTPAAELSLAEIASWTVERFGVRQALAYQAALIERINSIAAGESPRPRSCNLLMQGRPIDESLSYYREGSHHIILRDAAGVIEVLEFLHTSIDLPRHISAIG